MIEAGPSKQKVFSVRKNPLDSSRGEVKPNVHPLAWSRLFAAAIRTVCHAQLPV